METWRVPKCKICRCGVDVLEGTDSHIMAFTAVVDADVYLTAEGEARALARGRVTYELDGEGALWFRSDLDVVSFPVGSDRAGYETTVMVEHVCGRPAPARYTLTYTDVDVIVEELGEPGF